MDTGVAGTYNRRREQALHLAASTSGATVRSRARSISQALPSLRISTSPISASPSPISPIHGLVGVSKNTQNKAPGELRKLLAHLLSRLGARPEAPSVYDELRADSARKDSRRLGVVLDTVRSAVQFKAVKELSAAPVDRIGEDDSTTDEQSFSTDVTYGYMIQLRDVLILSDRHGWQILQTPFVSKLTHTTCH